MTAFTDEELQLAAQLSIPGGWDKAEAKPLKDKIKPVLLAKTSHCCCYCRRSMHGWHGLTIDIEHVLPKGNGKFSKYTFELRNLSVSCKRCNMSIKGSDTSFYSADFNEPDPFKSEHYKFIHPNLDNIDDHLEFVSEQHNAKIMVKYSIAVGSHKGNYAYQYFKLEKLEINSFDDAQDLPVVLPSEALPPDIAMEIAEVVDSAEAQEIN